MEQKFINKISPKDPAFFLKGKKGDFDLIWINDGVDYPALLDEFHQGNLDSTCLAIGDHPARETYLVKAFDRKFIFKRIYQPPERRKRHLWDLVSGTAFSRLMRETWKAIDRGCAIIPEVYLVAEKYIGYKYCTDSYLITEFIEGEVLQSCERDKIPRKWIDALGQTVARLHDCGLGSGAPHPFNLVETDEGMKMIDISFKGPMIICQGHDILDVKKKFNLDLPIKHWPLKVVSKLVFMKYSWHLWRKKVRNKLKNTSK